MKPPLVSIVTPVWNRKKECLACYTSLFKCDFPRTDMEVILVDNGSTDGTTEEVKEKFPTVKIITLEKNYGFSVAVNRGIVASRGEYMIILQSDLRVAEDYLTAIVSAAQKSLPCEGVFGPKVYKRGTKNKFHFAYGKLDKKSLHINIYGEGETDVGQYDLFHEVDVVAYSGLLIKREVLVHTGLLDERLFVTFMDTDFFIRAKKAGYTCMLVPQARVWDKDTTTFGSDSPQMLYYLMRNQLIVRNEHQPFSFFDHLRNFRFLFSTGIFSVLDGKRSSQHQAVMRGIVDFYLKTYGERKFGNS